MTTSQRRFNQYKIIQKRIRQLPKDIELSKSARGRLKKHSWYDCGNPRCGLCTTGTRRSRRGTKKDKLTIQERIVSHECDTWSHFYRIKY